MLQTDTIEIQRIIRYYLEELYSIKLKNPEKMDKFLNTYQNCIDSILKNLNRSIISNETKAGLKTLPTKGTQDQIGSLLNFTRRLKSTKTNASETIL